MGIVPIQEAVSSAAPRGDVPGSPSALLAEANQYLYIDLPRNTLPLRVNGEYAYYFTSSGVFGNYGVYFKVASGVPRFVGRWTPNPTTKPPWYGEIENVLNHLADWDGF